MKEVRLFLATLKQKGVRLYLEQGKLKSQAPAGGINNSERDFIKQNKQPIIEFLETLNKASAKNKQNVIVKQSSPSGHLSYAQQRLWFIDSLQGGSPEYNMPIAFEVNGQLDNALVTKVFTTILERHEVLRTGYIEKDGHTSVTVRSMAEIDFDIKRIDLTHLTDEILEAEVKSLVEADVTTTFNLAQDIPLRVSYLQKSVDAGVMIFNMHHIASDGWSLEVLTKEFFALYQAYSQNQSNPLPPLAIQYSDYADWQREYLKSEVLESQLGYWQKQLDELPAVHSLPLDKARPNIKRHEGAIVSGSLPAATAKQLLATAKTHKLTPFMLLHGALSLLLSRHSNSNDIVVGTPVANRLQAELEPLIGFFVNTQVLRADTAKETLSDYFAHIRQVHLDAQVNQDVPFELLVDRLKAPRSMAHGPLFQIMMTTNTDYGVDNASQLDTFSLSNAECTLYPASFIQAKFDLTVDLSISEQGVGLNWTFDINLFTEQHIAQLNTHLCRLLELIGKSSTESSPALDTLTLLSDVEVEHLLHGVNDTKMDYPVDACIHQLFEQQAQQNPDKVAVRFEDKSLSYQNLNEKANQLAHYLVENHKIKPDTLVGICVERSIEMVIGILAVLKAGGAYVPLDPSYPAERLNYMLEDASVDVVLSQTQLQEVLAEFNGTILSLDGLSEGAHHWCNSYIKTNPQATQLGLTSSNLAYVIYTSGSTGQPKGVMIEHRNTVAMLCWGQKNYTQAELSVVLASTSLNFDLSIYELFLPLSAGTQLRIVKNVLDLVSSDQVDDVTLVNTVPSAMDALLKMKVLPSGVKVINLAGEALKDSLVNGILDVYPQVAVCNLYGPSEDTTYSTYARFNQKITHNPHIGRVISNSSGLILNEAKQLVPFGVAGELYLGGDGLSRGYLNRPELTAASYIDNPFYDSANANSSARLYRTGDLVRYLADGNLQYIGRVDHQVKIRGFRIELGEVETKLAQADTVDSALVMAKTLAGAQQLVAYIKPQVPVAENVAEFITALKNKLGQSLPEYMVPSIIMVLEQWPLTPNGKVDRKALPVPQGSALQGEYVAPKTEVEIKLAGILAQLLELPEDKISANASFFDLGASSIMLIKVLHQIQQEFDIKILVEKLYQNQNISALAGFIEEENAIQKITQIEEGESQWEI